MNAKWKELGLRCTWWGAALLWVGCKADTWQTVLGRTKDVQTYTLIEVVNPLKIDRPQEIVEIPLTTIQSRYRSFNPEDFSVHLLGREFLPEGDPIMASNPPPEIPGQVIDQNRDGSPDTLLALMDFGANESHTLAVASPRFSLLLPPPLNHARAELWLKAAGGEYSASDVALLPFGSKIDSGIYQFGGPVMETDAIGWRIPVGAYPWVDVMGKRAEGMVLTDNVAKEYQDPAMFSAAQSLIGKSNGFGAGTLAQAIDESCARIASHGPVQYRRLENGPVMSEIEIRIEDCQLGEQRFDVSWYIAAFAGNSFLRHEIQVERTGHSLAFAIDDQGGEMREKPSREFGWMRTITYGSTNVRTGVGGALGMGLMIRGNLTNGFVEFTRDTLGVRLYPMQRSFSLFTFSSWSMAPGGATDIEALARMMDAFAERQNSKVQARNIDHAGA